jgi:very-short-patch-repair endonuclease
MDLYAWAARHDGLITTDVAQEAGMSARQIERAVAIGRLRRLREGVLVVAGAPPTWRQQVRAVLLSLPETVAGSHGTAVRLLGGSSEFEDGTINVLGPLPKQIRLEGVTAHRSGLLMPEDIVMRDGIRCTSALQTVIDMSGSLDWKQLGKLTDDFLRRRLLLLEDLRGRVALTRPAPGRSPKTLRRVLADRIPGYDPGESELEGRLRRIIDRYGFPRPSQQHRVELDGARYRLDFAWPEHRVFVEGNGFGWHQLSSDLDGGARRQNRLVKQGWRPIELTWRMPDAEIVADLAAVLPLGLQR